MMVVVHCNQCEKDFRCHTPHPVKCGVCGSKKWNSDVKNENYHIELPVFEHKEALPLKPGMHCPYETVPKSHTILMNSDLSDVRYYCCSCDACWNRYNEFIGVRVGIGVKR